MPNWCNNVLELAHKASAMIERARVAFDDGKLCNEFVPVPEPLHIVAGRVSDEAEQAKLEAAEASNKEAYGYDNWYDYCVNEWGTKWDVGGDGMTADVSPDGRLTMSFDSAWSPPIAFYEKMLDLGFEVRAYYYESGMCYAGIWEDGIDDYYDLSDCSNADEAEATLPTVLDEMFCITESMRDYEAENAEDEDEVQIWYEDGVEKKGLEPHTTKSE